MGAYVVYCRKKCPCTAISAAGRAVAACSCAFVVGPREKHLSLALNLARSDRFFCSAWLSLFLSRVFGEQAVSLLFHFAQDTGNRRIWPHVSERTKRSLMF